MENAYYEKTVNRLQYFFAPKWSDLLIPFYSSFLQPPSPYEVGMWGTLEQFFWAEWPWLWGPFNIWRHFWLFQLGARDRGIQWMEATDAAKHTKMHRAFLHCRGMALPWHPDDLECVHLIMQAKASIVVHWATGTLCNAPGIYRDRLTTPKLSLPTSLSPPVQAPGTF